MKLQTQFTFLKKDKGVLNYMKKIQTLEKTLKLNCQDYPSEKNNAIYCD